MWLRLASGVLAQLPPLGPKAMTSTAHRDHRVCLKLTLPFPIGSVFLAVRECRGARTHACPCLPQGTPVAAVACFPLLRRPYTLSRLSCTLSYLCPYATPSGVPRPTQAVRSGLAARAAPRSFSTDAGEEVEMNLVGAVNDAMRIAMKTDDKVRKRKRPVCGLALVSRCCNPP